MNQGCHPGFPHPGMIPGRPHTAAVKLVLQTARSSVIPCAGFPGPPGMLPGMMPGMVPGMPGMMTPGMPYGPRPGFPPGMLGPRPGTGPSLLIIRPGTSIFWRCRLSGMHRHRTWCNSARDFLVTGCCTEARRVGLNVPSLLHCS